MRYIELLIKKYSFFYLKKILVKWLLILEPSCVYEEMRYLKLIANCLAPPKSSQYYPPKLNHANILNQLRVIIESCIHSYSDEELIIPFSNAFIFFDVKPIKKFYFDKRIFIFLHKNSICFH